MGRVTARRPIRRITADGNRRRLDSVIAEEPLELRVIAPGGSSAPDDAGARAVGPFLTPASPDVTSTVTMRTPGDDIDLAHGFLYAEGVISRADDVASMSYCAGRGADGANTYNVLDVRLRRGVPRTLRTVATSSACGVCGTPTLDALRLRPRFDIASNPLTTAPTTLTAMAAALRAGQRLFEATGGLHAAGLFTADGELLVLREDVGRHNAVDKVIGWAVREGRLPLDRHVLVVSSRASFELTQKAALAGIPVLAAVSAPSTMAIDTAAEAGLTLVGFLRGASMNVYTRADRIS